MLETALSDEYFRQLQNKTRQVKLTGFTCRVNVIEYKNSQ